MQYGKKWGLLTALLTALVFCGNSFGDNSASLGNAPPAPAQTDNLAFTNWLLWKLSDYMNRTVNAEVATQKNLMYQPTPNLNNSIAANLGQTASRQEAQNIANQDVLKSLKLLVTTSDNTTIVNTASKEVPVTVSMANQIGSAFNLNTVLDNTNYNSKQAKMAQNYIAFASGIVRPYEVLDPKKILSKDLNNLSDYKVQLGIATARATAALSTLYQLLAERTPQTGLGTLSQATVDSNGNVSFAEGAAAPADVSPLLVAQYNAEKRSSNPGWYQSMETATPATLQRESLYTMADIQKSLFDLRMIMERQTALLAMISLQQNEAQQRVILQSDEDAVNQAAGIQKTP
ncbi:MAG: hypothetical protein K0R12_918 [Gammaproteobacteria bacterium]|jgi:hypothetical protein|nr:hypothetical protein [Gammaproteobacteria bacterium]